MSRRILQIITKVLLTICTDPLTIAQIWRYRGIQIGEGTFIYRDVVFGMGAHDKIFIGKNCTLTGCAIIGHDASTNKYLGIPYGKASPSLPIIIEDNCFIGFRSIILMGVQIGHDSIVGAGAVVTKNVLPNSVVGGNPAKFICSVDDLIAKRKILAIEHPEFFSYYPNCLEKNE